MFWRFSLFSLTVCILGEGHVNHIHQLFWSSMNQQYCLLLKPKGHSTVFRNLDSDSGMLIKIIYWVLLPVHNEKGKILPT